MENCTYHFAGSFCSPAVFPFVMWCTQGKGKINPKLLRKKGGNHAVPPNSSGSNEVISRASLSLSGTGAPLLSANSDGTRIWALKPIQEPILCLYIKGAFSRECRWRVSSVTSLSGELREKMSRHLSQHSNTKVQLLLLLSYQRLIVLFMSKLRDWGSSRRSQCKKVSGRGIFEGFLRQR